MDVPLTFDQTIRDVIRQLSHLPIGHTFYFVVLDFDVSVVSESTRGHMEYEKTLDDLSGRQVNVLEAVGDDVNDKLCKCLSLHSCSSGDFFTLPYPTRHYSTFLMVR